ncbi:hypothetical protein J1N35_001022 [Gossypium stocksii]|uniref:Factor of DNA methylation 1-5/IDN2 domain-containing protein n=1 Tax=Gossypium stocksii TaxID=47602 RepID=A0A9D3WJ63_9ROSI|nr:hypothetical protein J1N35_001022 [Gossypium stocksii]
MAKPLKEQAFATLEAVAELVQKVHSAIQRELLVVIAKMKLYLQNPSTRSILFKPIKTNIMEAHIQIQSLLKAEYSPEEKCTINMVWSRSIKKLCCAGINCGPKFQSTLTTLDEAEIQATTLCTSWQENLKKPDWHPIFRRNEQILSRNRVKRFKIQW